MLAGFVDVPFLPMAAGRDVSNWTLAGPKRIIKYGLRRAICLKTCRNGESYWERGMQTFLFRCSLVCNLNEVNKLQAFCVFWAWCRIVSTVRGLFCSQAWAIATAFKTKTGSDWQILRGHLGDALGSSRTTFKIFYFSGFLGIVLWLFLPSSYSSCVCMWTRDCSFQGWSFSTLQQC